jgi:hypothetical protein
MTGWLVTIGAAAAAAAWYGVTRSRDVRCSLDLEATQEHFHAHAALDGVAVDAGDEVLVHGAPSRLPHGLRTTVDTTATVREASWLKRRWVKLTGGTAFHELYDVGFEG